MTRRIFLETYFDTEDASRFALDLDDGTHLEGHPLSFEDDRVLFDYSSPVNPNVAEWFAFDGIRLDALWYWSDQSVGWVRFTGPT